MPIALREDAEVFYTTLSGQLTDAELHAMADAIGVSRRWHQAPPKHRSHYDIALSKRAAAIATHCANSPGKPSP